MTPTQRKMPSEHKGPSVTTTLGLYAYSCELVYLCMAKLFIIQPSYYSWLRRIAFSWLSDIVLSELSTLSQYTRISILFYIYWHGRM
jgi:hypothetical protein